MTPFILSLVVMYVAWWMLQSEFRRFLYNEWTQKPFTTWEHLKAAVPHVLRQLSQQNNQAQCFVDGELKILNQRRSFMLLSFHRLAILFPGLMLLATLQIEVFVVLAAIGTIMLMVFFKKPGRWIQICFLAGVFFMTYQWSYYQANQWVFSQDVSELVYMMADARIFTMLGFLSAGIILTILVRYEYWSLWFSSILFFAGGIAYLNVFSLILGEAIGWAIFWLVLSRGSSKRNKTIQLEAFAVTLLTAIIYVNLLLFMKSLGMLDIRILGPVISKKISFVLGWALWEILLTVGLMIWGHFRSQSQISETTDLESIKLPLPALGQGLLKYRGWLQDQLEFRRNEIERRLTSIETSQKQMNDSHPAAVPLPLLQKSLVEVESLKRLLGALAKNSL